MYPTPPPAWTCASKEAPHAAPPDCLGAVPGLLTAGAATSTTGPDSVSRNGTESQWQLRLDASHLARAANGVYYLRLVIPERVRAMHPGLPRELRRSTKTTLKTVALRKAREMCAELVTSLSPFESNMLVSSPASSSACPQGFRLDYVNGTLHTEIYPGANAETLGILARVLPLFAQQRPQMAPAADACEPGRPPAPATAHPTAPGPGAQPHHPAFLEPAADHRPPRAGHGMGQACGEAPPHATADGHENAASQETATKPGNIIWLSEAIEEWLENGANRFSAHTWKFSYAPSFRVLRELLGTERRDIVKADGTIVPNQLDIRIADLRRAHIEQLYKQLKQMPQRQGKRQDGVEAQVLIAQANANKLPVQSPSSVAKKLRHVFPWFEHAIRKDWIDVGVAHEFKLILEAAEARADLVSTAQGVHKAGAVALSIEELCRTYESQAYITGAVERDWKYWCDPLRLYTGARVSEVAQLFTNDLIEVDGVPCISIVNDIPKVGKDVDDREADFGGAVSKAETFAEYRRLKNQASRRIIPVHPKLIEMGFLDWVRHRQEIVGSVPGLLFFGLPWAPKSGYGRKPAEHTLRLLKEAQVWQPRRKVGHSLRSTLSQELLRVGMPAELIDRFLGHSLGTQREQAYSETDQGPAYPVRLALQFLEKTDFRVRFPTRTEINALRQEHAKAGQLRRARGAACAEAASASTA